MLILIEHIAFHQVKEPISTFGDFVEFFTFFE